MRLAETPRYLLLEISGIVPGLNQAFQECLIGSLVRSIALIHRTEFQRPLMHSPKSGIDLRKLGSRDDAGVSTITEDSMDHCCLEFPETEGKTIDRIRYIYDPSGPPEIDIRFTDGVSLSIKVQVGVKVEGELYRVQEGDVQILNRYPGV